MSLDRVSSGRDMPRDFNVIIESPAHGEPNKYEVDKDTGAMFVDKLISLNRDIESPRDLPERVLSQISHFFEHYKDLEAGKWVKVQGWVGAEEAKAEILAGVQRSQAAPEKPHF